MHSAVVPGTTTIKCMALCMVNNEGDTASQQELDHHQSDIDPKDNGVLFSYRLKAAGSTTETRITQPLYTYMYVDIDVDGNLHLKSVGAKMPPVSLCSAASHTSISKTP